jgi:DNA-binding beta-propeller fold protein YncE
MHDGIIQKYTWEGELLLQIGTRGMFDTSDGTIEGEALNTGTDQFFKPSGVAVDPDTNDVYVSDGYGNRRVAVFDQEGRFLRQWGRQATPEESRAGLPGVFARVVHGIALSNARLVYVCDRQGNRVQVFERSGEFVRNIWVDTGADVPDARGTAWWVGFSPDEDQKLLYVMDGRNEKVHVLDHESGEILSSFGRPGHQIGAFTHGHTLAVDSESSVYVGETDNGRRVQKFRMMGA